MEDDPVIGGVLFDFGGTLDADGLTWKERFWDLFRREGLEVTSERFDHCFYAADDALVGTIPATLSLRDTVSRLATALATALAVRDPAAGDRVARGFLDDAYACLSASAALVTRLARRYRVGVVSNFYGNLRAVCAEVGLAPSLSATIDSVDVGVQKPDPRIFAEASRALGMPPSRTLFIGDSLTRDMAGAREAGMRHVWLRGDPARPGQPCCPGDVIVGRLAEVEAVLA